MPGNFRDGPEKLHLARKPGIIFQSPEVFKNKTNFITFRGISKNSTNIWVIIVQISSEVVFYDAKYYNLRPIFAVSRKNSFRKVVTLKKYTHRSQPNHGTRRKNKHIKGPTIIHLAAGKYIDISQLGSKQNAR